MSEQTGSQMKYANLDDFLRETESELKLGFKKLYFEDDYWKIMYKRTVGGSYHLLAEYADVPGALETALRELHTAEI